MSPSMRENMSPPPSTIVEPCIQPTDIESKTFSISNATARTSKIESKDVPRKKRLSEEGRGVWTPAEHKKFLEGINIYPKGPWKLVATYVGTRNARQTMTHAQKYRQKLARRMRGLRTRRKQPKQDALANQASEKNINDFFGDLSTPELLLTFLPEECEEEEIEEENKLSCSIDLQTCFSTMSENAISPCYRASSPSDFTEMEIPPFEECLDYLIGALA
jgi:hypothetical protein